MFICKDCAKVFEDTEVLRIKDYVVSDPYPDGPYISVCPNCQSEDIEEAKRCSCCDEYAPSEDMTEGFCSTCTANTMKRFRRLVFEKFTEQEIALINTMLDGAEI